MAKPNTKKIDRLIADAERKLAAVTSEIDSRLGAELTAFRNEKQRVINEAAAAKVAKKTESRWW